MARHAAVGVDDDLAAGQAGVSHGAAGHECTGGIKDVVRPGDVQVGCRQHGIDHVRGEVGAQLFEAGAFRVLAGDHDGFD
ncbi:hypothetical protein D9M72_542110 [compost metagenome]